MEYGKNQTSLFICTVDFDNSYKFVRDFADVTEQYNYFNSLSSKWDMGDNFRFVDGEGGDTFHKDIKINARPEMVEKFNYCVYNNNTEEGYVYCFITSVDFINYEVAILHLELDVFQTFQFKFQMLETYIKRNTVHADNYRYWELDDFMPVRNVYARSHTDLINTADVLPYMVLSRVAVSDGAGPVFNDSPLVKIGNSFFPFYILVCSSISEFLTIFAGLQEWERYSKDNIISVGFVSKMVVSYGCLLTNDPQIINNTTYPLYYGESQSINVYTRHFEDVVNPMRIAINRPVSMADLYTPKNKKLLSYPYTYLELQTVGKQLPLRFEKSNNEGTITIELRFGFEDCFKCYAFPLNYEGSGAEEPNYNYSFEIPISSSVPYSKDSYYDFLNLSSQKRKAEEENNAVTAVAGGLGILGGLVMFGAGVASENAALMYGGGSAIVGGLTQELTAAKSHNTLTAELEQANQSRTQEIQGNVTSDIFQLANGFWAKAVTKQIDPLYEYDVDCQFAIYGYKIDKILTPNLKNRTYWDYIQTQNCNIVPTGNYFMTDNFKSKVESIFNNGVIIWHDKINKCGDFMAHAYLNPIRS